MKKKQMVLAVLLVFVVSFFTGCQQASSPSSTLTVVASNGFTSPEQAAEFVVQAVVESRQEDALTAFASTKLPTDGTIITPADNIPPVLQQALSLQEGDNETRREMEQERFSENERYMLQNFVQAFLPPTVSTAESGAISNASEIQTSLKGLSIVSIDTPPLASQADAKDAFKKTAQELGADEMTERILLYKWQGATYLGGMTFVRFGNDWFVYNLHSALVGTPPNGSVLPMEEEVYRKILTSETEQDSSMGTASGSGSGTQMSGQQSGNSTQEVSSSSSSSSKK